MYRGSRRDIRDSARFGAKSGRVEACLRRIHRLEILIHGRLFCQMVITAHWVCDKIVGREKNIFFRLFFLPIYM
jgi:hypothetical protein